MRTNPALPRGSPHALGAGLAEGNNGTNGCERNARSPTERTGGRKLDHSAGKSSIRKNGLELRPGREKEGEGFLCHAQFAGLLCSRRELAKSWQEKGLDLVSNRHGSDSIDEHTISPERGACKRCYKLFREGTDTARHPRYSAFATHTAQAPLEPLTPGPSATWEARSFATPVALTARSSSPVAHEVPRGPCRRTDGRVTEPRAFRKRGRHRRGSPNWRAPRAPSPPTKSSDLGTWQTLPTDAFTAESELYDYRSSKAAANGNWPQSSTGPISTTSATIAPGSTQPRMRTSAACWSSSDSTKKTSVLAPSLIGLTVWDKPASACLSSRIPYGTQVTRERLAQIGGLEADLRRLRTAAASGAMACSPRRRRGTRRPGGLLAETVALARIEVAREELAKAFELRDAITEAGQRFGFSYVTLDLQGYRTGSHNEVIGRRSLKVV